MPPKSAADVTAKWASRTTAASADYVKGIQAVTQSPGQAAAAKVNKMRAGIQEALDSGKWERNVASVSVTDWKDAAVNKGAARLASGVQAAQPKMQRFLTDFLPFQAQVVAQAEQMDDTTLEGRLQKALAVMRGTHEYSRNRR